MAKLNLVFLYGIVSIEPKIYYRKEDNSPLRADLTITVIKRINNDPGKENVLFESYPTNITMEADRIKDISSLKKGDFVQIKGVFTARVGDKKIKCKSCGGFNVIKDSAISYITPLSVEKMVDKKNSDPNLKDSIALKKHHEISNLVLMIGAVSGAINYYKDESSKVEVSSYPIGVNRQYYIKEDDPNKKTDYIWIKSFNEQAREDKETLRLGDVVLINGYLSTRIAEKVCHCEHCLTPFTWKDKIMEVSPYSVEHLFNNREKSVFGDMGDIFGNQDSHPEIPSDLSFIDDDYVDEDINSDDLENYIGAPEREDSIGNNDDINEFLKSLLSNGL